MERNCFKTLIDSATIIIIDKSNKIDDMKPHQGVNIASHGLISIIKYNFIRIYQLMSIFQKFFPCYFLSIAVLIVTSTMSSDCIFFAGRICKSVWWNLYWTRRENSPVKWHKWFYFQLTWSVQWIPRIYTYHSFEPKTRK